MTAGTLSVPLQFPGERASVRRAYRSGREGGNVRARQVQEREMRVWSLQWEPATDGDRYLVRTAFDLAGTVLDLDWTPPNESAIRVRFSEAPRFVQVNAKVWQVSCVLEEVL